MQLNLSPRQNDRWPARETSCIRQSLGESYVHAAGEGTRKDDWDCGHKVASARLISPTFYTARQSITNYMERGHQLCSNSIVFQHFMETEGSLPHSQELTICPYPEPE
jgi:hypothetical protein